MIFKLFNTLFLSLGYLALGWGVPVLIILLLTHICRNAERTIDSTLGPKTEIYAGFLGIMVHETSHWLFAKLFHHRIVDVKLLVMPWDVNLNEEHPRLGYVNTTYSDHSFYQMIGTAFIGTAPIYGCTAVIYLIYRLFTPNLLKLMTHTAESLISNPLSFSWNDFLYSFVELWKFDSRTLLLVTFAFYLIINITLTGFDLSDADLKSSYTAGIWILIFMSAIILPMVYFQMTDFLNYYLIGFVIWIVAIFSLSILTALLVDFGCHILHFFIN